jgi:hypothetical protein
LLSRDRHAWRKWRLNRFLPLVFRAGNRRLNRRLLVLGRGGQGQQQERKDSKGAHGQEAWGGGGWCEEET